eukprot:c1476_g1_i1.p1 GENE.c1476_g1_i1~~c1476_g1_i1.p1  ORF type:complete len:263 (+),score=24.24 c1476_g1_i1:44-832(+)
MLRWYLLLCVFGTPQARYCELNTAGTVSCNLNAYDSCGFLYKQTHPENWCLIRPGSSWTQTQVCCAATLRECCAYAGITAVLLWLLPVLGLSCCFLACCCHDAIRTSFCFCFKCFFRVPACCSRPGPPQFQIRKKKSCICWPSKRKDRFTVSDGVKECVVCMEHRRDVILPCGHTNLCRACAETILTTSHHCPTCRQNFTTFRTAVGPQPSFKEMMDFNPDSQTTPDPIPASNNPNIDNNPPYPRPGQTYELPLPPPNILYL